MTKELSKSYGQPLDLGAGNNTDQQLISKFSLLARKTYANKIKLDSVRGILAVANFCQDQKHIKVKVSSKMSEETLAFKVRIPDGELEKISLEDFETL